MCLAPAGSIPPPIDIDGLAIGIELDISGIGDLDWPAAAGGCPELPHAAATSASAPTPTANRKAEPGRQRPGDTDPDMDQPPHVPAPATGRATDCSEDASKDAPTAPLIALSANEEPQNRPGEPTSFAVFRRGLRHPGTASPLSQGVLNSGHAAVPPHALVSQHGSGDALAGHRRQVQGAGLPRHGTSRGDRPALPGAGRLAVAHRLHLRGLCRPARSGPWQARGPRGGRPSPGPPGPPPPGPGPGAGTAR